VEITSATFPSRQRLAETTELRLGVKNTGRRIIPHLAITISTDKSAIRPFSIRDPQPGLAQPDRPVWILENKYPRLVGATPDYVPATANEKTFDFGQLNPGDTTEGEWRVTPVRPGTFRISYQVDAGLSGNGKAVTADGEAPTGSFVVNINATPPQTKVDSAGNVVIIKGKNGAVVAGGGSAGGAAQSSPSP